MNMKTMLAAWIGWGPAALLLAFPAFAGVPERTSPADGAVQVYVPGGEFTMGVDDPEAPMADEQRPPHKVRLSPFWMDKYEVTNEQYARFLNALLAENGTNWTDRQAFESVHARVLLEHPLGGLEYNARQRRVTVKPGRNRHPVMPVSWQAATEYADRMGRRLPTEAEWEFAARGTDGRRYPWGNEWHARWTNVGTRAPAAVDAFPKDVSPFGVIGLAGNIREWIQDCYDINFYASSPKNNPVAGPGPGASGSMRVVRGGSFMLTEWDARTTSRYRGIVSDNRPQPGMGIRTVGNADAAN